jgi:CheY-like chemotaxis protein
MSNVPTEPSSVVLVVEVRGYCAQLEEAGFEVLEASNADEALEVMKSRPDVRVLFTDVQIPGQFDGMHLARQIHEQWPKIMLLITSENRRTAKADLPDGRFLAKPYRAQDVIKEIRMLTREGRAIIPDAA